jgi:hypothetical protein
MFGVGGDFGVTLLSDISDPLSCKSTNIRTVQTFSQWRPSFSRTRSLTDKIAITSTRLCHNSKLECIFTSSPIMDKENKKCHLKVFPQNKAVKCQLDKFCLPTPTCRAIRWKNRTIESSWTKSMLLCSTLIPADGSWVAEMDLLSPTW